MKLLLFVGCCFLFHLVTADYYWRDFHGEIPSDAFPAGTDKSGNTTYIGQTYFPHADVLFPTTIFQGDKNAYSDWKVLIKSDNNTKILCTKNPKTLKWIKTTASSMKMWQNCNKLIGGYNTGVGATIWIGRANFEDRIHISKIYDVPLYHWQGLWVWTDLHIGVFLNTFEMLVFGCAPRIFLRH